MSWGFAVSWALAVLCGAGSGFGQVRKLGMLAAYLKQRLYRRDVPAQAPGGVLYASPAGELHARSRQYWGDGATRQRGPGALLVLLYPLPNGVVLEGFLQSLHLWPVVLDDRLVSIRRNRGACCWCGEEDDVIEAEVAQAGG